MFLQDSRKYFSLLSENYPSLPILIGIITGIIPLVILDGLQIHYAVIAALLMTLLSSVFAGRKFTVKFSSFLAISLIIVIVNFKISDGSYVAQIKTENRSAIIEAEVIDTSCVNFEKDWLSNPNYVNIKVNKLKFSEVDNWMESDGESILRLPYDSKHINYGDILLIKGRFESADGTLFEGGFDYSRFLFYRGIHRVFIAESFEITGHRKGFYEGVLNIRDELIEMSVENIKNDENKRLLTSLLFGCRQALDWKNKRSFIRSGTIHIFAVSGLQVGILGLVFFWIFRPLPFRTRYLLVPFLIFIYAIMTGMQSPAVRALMMISVWSFSRAFLYSTSPLNAVFFSASLLLLYNPFYVTDIGFQYTFVIVAFLIMAYNNASSWFEAVSEKLKWVPVTEISAVSYRKSKLIILAVSSLATCIIAWIASIGISASYQGLYVPFAIAANIIISPLITLIFIVSIVKLLFTSLYPVSWLAGWLIDRIFSFVNLLSDFFAENYDFCIVKPPEWTLFLLYTALAAIIIFQNRKVFFVSLSVIVSVLIFWNLRQDFQDDTFYVFYGGSNSEPALLLCSYPEKKAILINAPSYEVSRSISNLLSLKGISSIDTLIITQNLKDFCKGASYLSSSIRINQLILPGKYERGKYSANLVKMLFPSGAMIRKGLETEQKNWSFESGNIKTLYENGVFKVDYFSASGVVSIKIREIDTSEKIIEIVLNDGKTYIMALENINKLSMKSLKLL